MIPLHAQPVNLTLKGVPKRLHFSPEVMLVWAHWYACYPLSLLSKKEWSAERGFLVDQATVYRRALKMLFSLGAVFLRQEHTVGLSWRIEERYILVVGCWKHLGLALPRLG